MTAPTLGEGLGLDSLACLDMFDIGNTFPGQSKPDRYVCAKCHSTSFQSKNGGALMVCKRCGHILADHVENVEQEYEHVLVHKQ